MHYWSMVISRAWSDSWSLVSGSPLPAFVVAALVFGLSLFISRRWFGHEVMKDKLRAATVSVAATVVIGVVVFLVHAFVVSPNRTYREKETQCLKAEKSAKTEAAKAAELESRLATLEAQFNSQLVRLQQANELLRDKLADARAARPVELRVPTDVTLQRVEPPVIEGIRWVPKPLDTSPYADAPYGIKLTVQTNVSLQPVWQLVFFCTVPIVKGDYVAPHRGGTGISGGNYGVATADPMVYIVRETMVPFEPDEPVVVRLYAASPIEVVRLEYKKL